MSRYGYMILLYIYLIVFLPRSVRCDAHENVSLDELESQVKFLTQARQDDQRKSQDELFPELSSQVRSLITAQSLNRLTSRQAYPGYVYAFTACVSVADIRQLGAQQTIVFNHTITNQGGAFHTNTGIFTAPLDDMYVLHVSLMTTAGHLMYFQLVRDGHYVDNMLTDGRGDTSWESNTELWTLKLNQRSEVWIRSQDPGDVHGGCHTMWSGFLLYAID